MNETFIISNALSAIGCKYDTESKLVRVASNLYPGIRDKILKENESPCSIKLTYLYNHESSDITGFKYRFKAPVDLLKLVSADNESIFDDKYIYSNSKAISIRYVYQNTNISSFDNGLIEAIETALSTRMEGLKRYKGDL